MLIDLCWSTADDTTGVPGEYLAPSWSWASLHGKVAYRFPSSSPTFKRVAEFIDARLKFSTADSYGTVEDGWIHLFGHLSPVTLIRERTAVAGIQGPGHWHETVGGYKMCSAGGGGLSFVDFADVTLDFESSAGGGRRSAPMFCLPLLSVGGPAHNEEFYRQLFYCLLLVPNGLSAHVSSPEILPSPRSQDMDEFQRFGLARIMVKNRTAFQAWLRGNPERDVLIR